MLENIMSTGAKLKRVQMNISKSIFLIRLNIVGEVIVTILPILMIHLALIIAMRSDQMVDFLNAIDGDHDAYFRIYIGYIIHATFCVALANWRIQKYERAHPKSFEQGNFFFVIKIAVVILNLVLTNKAFPLLRDWSEVITPNDLFSSLVPTVPDLLGNLVFGMFIFIFVFVLHIHGRWSRKTNLKIVFRSLMARELNFTGSEYLFVLLPLLVKPAIVLIAVRGGRKISDQ